MASCGQVCWFGTCVDESSREVDAPGTALALETSVETTSCETEVTWEDFAGPFVRTWCTPCHSADLDGVWRLGAPEGVNFDGYDDVVLSAAMVKIFATGDTATMPPSGGPSEEERAELEEWLRCGTPGTPTPVGACDHLEWIEGDRVVGSEDQAVEFCADGNAVRGDLVVNEIGALADCLCVVEGDLTVTGSRNTQANLAALQDVAGSVSIAGNDHLLDVSLPELERAGSLHLAANPVLTVVHLPNLEAVDGDFVAFEDGVGGTLEPSRLQTVGGDLLVEGNPRLTLLALPQLDVVSGSLTVAANPVLDEVRYSDTLRLVGGDLILHDNAALTTEVWFRAPSAVGGDLEVSANPLMGALHGFYSLNEVGGSVELAELNAAAVLDGFDVLTTVGGSVLLRDHAWMSSIDGFDGLLHIGGDLAVEANPELLELVGFGGLRSVGGNIWLTRDPKLDKVEGLVSLETVSGDFVFSGINRINVLNGSAREIVGVLRIENTGRLDDLRVWDALEVVGGIELVGNQDLVSLEGLAGLHTVHGSVVLGENPRLVSLAGLQGIAVIEGELELRDNERLEDVGAFESVELLGGDLRVFGNRSLLDKDVENLVRSIETIGGEVHTKNNGGPK
jgi:hypothetical protein